MDALKHIPHLFDRPAEPMFNFRDNVIFNVPKELMCEQHISLYDTVQKRCSAAHAQVVPIKPINPPDLSEIVKLKRYESFSMFNRTHLEYANKLIRILIDTSETGLPDAESFLAACVYAREQVNIHLFVYAVSVAILHRDDTKNVDIPSDVQVFPHMYIDSSVFSPLIEKFVNSEDRKVTIISNGPTASDLELEHRLAYWREDVGLNLHHWHWHLVYPHGTSKEDLPIVNKDRRGELFYYMHQQMIARYNFERFSLYIPRVRRFNNFQEPIPEGYYPRLHDRTTGRDLASRQADSVWQDLRREQEQMIVDINHMDRWRDAIMNAIHVKEVETEDGTTISLEDEKGIDILGNMVEASILSPNYQLYGNLHNMGHAMIAYIHDPDHRHLQQHGPMGDPKTSMRDPAFFPWHAYIDDIFQTHKELLEPYDKKELDFPGVIVDGVTVQVENGNDNEFATFFQQAKVDVHKGLNFLPRGSCMVTISHLDHAQFTYNIQVNNESGAELIGTVRIFMAPHNDERNMKFIFQHQRRFFVELDRFYVTLKNGQNLIRRHSKDSSVTIPFDQLFATENQNIKNNFCKCGWPDYLLIPRGNTAGLSADLFVMISDSRVDIEPGTNTVNADVKGKCCKIAPEYCGLRGKKYPDKRAMGFPFDRRPRQPEQTLDNFLTPNMFVQKVTIKFDNKTLPPKEDPNVNQKSEPQNTSTNFGCSLIN